jgi:membrane fusion protein (multidrug efflux system)
MAAVLTGICVGCKHETPPPAAPPNVVIASVTQRDVPIYKEWVGSTDGSTNAAIRAQVTGYLVNQAYEDGTETKRGGLLFEIDPRPFQAALDQAKATLAQGQAQQGKTELDVKRYAPLAKEKAISQEELDDAIQANLAAKAQVQAAQAVVEQAQLNLSFTRIVAPIDGIIGIAKVGVGDLISPNSGELTTMSTVNPIKVNFFISEHEYLRASKQRDFRGWHESGRGPEIELLLADGSSYAFKGYINAADRQVDPKTGTIQISGLFPNPKRVLRPGMFVRVRSVVEVKEKTLLVPQRAVIELQDKQLVAVVGADNKVSMRPVKVGEQIESEWIITAGLQAGERVIVDGIQKVRQGAPVTPTLMTEPPPAPTVKPVAK